MLEFRLNAYRQWLKMKEPNWSDNKYPAIDFQVRLRESRLSPHSICCCDGVLAPGRGFHRGEPLPAAALSLKSAPCRACHRRTWCTTRSPR